MSGVMLTISLIVVGAPGLSLTSDFGADGQSHLDLARSRGFSAALGEFETLVLHIKNDGEARDLKSVELVWAGQDESFLLAYRPAMASDYVPGATHLADAYALLDSVSLPKDTNTELLLALYISPYEKPGKQRGEIQATFEDGAVATCNFEIQVYDFSLPPMRTLPAVFGLDVKALAGTADVLSDLDSWTPVYDGLAALGIACRVWIEPAIDPATTNMNDTVLQHHLAYIAATMDAPVVDVGGAPGYYSARLPLPTPTMPQDTLQTHLHALLSKLPSIGHGQRPVAEPGTFGPRSQWSALRQEYARFHRADDRIARILISPAHPHFERYTDIWALPPWTAPELIKLLVSGQSTVRYDQSAISVCVGTEGALDRTNQYQTLASEATDGSEATVWRAATSGAVPEPWIELTFRNHVEVKRITLLGADATTMSDPTVETAYRAGDYARATVSWEASGHLSESGFPVRVGEFRHPRECQSIRLHFAPHGDARPIEIAEILINNKNLETVSNPIAPLIPWLDAASPDYKGWGSDVRYGAGAARAVAWHCWALGFQGVLGPSLNGAMPAGTPLAGSGVRQLLPTRRLFALRDGLDDYEYLRLYWNRIADGELKRLPDFAPGLGADTIAWSIEGDQARQKARDKMGKLLSGDGVVTTNFGP